MFGGGKVIILSVAARQEGDFERGGVCWKGFTIEGENNGDPSKRDSGGKYVLGVEGIHWWRRTRGRACSTGAPNPDDIAPRYTTRDFIAYYRTVQGI